MYELEERERKAKHDEAEAARQKQAEEEAFRVRESPPQDENYEELDYYDDVERDTEMSSQETVPTSSQETVPMLSQETVPALSQEMAPAFSQESASQYTASMPSQESTTDATILDAIGRILMEDKACLEGPTLKCTPFGGEDIIEPVIQRDTRPTT